MHKIIIELVWGMPEAPTIRQEIGISALNRIHKLEFQIISIAGH